MHVTTHVDTHPYPPQTHTQVDDVTDMTAPLRSVDLHNTRRVVSEIAHVGANLHDRLVAEGSLGDVRER